MTPLTVGQTLSHYRLIEKIGEGGMGVVWKATDTTLGRDVAVKILPDVFVADPERLARFDREARLLASLNHAHIASIYAFQSAGGIHFLVMELVEGEDLAMRIGRGAVPVDETLAIARQLADALESAHERGIVHRDLKPANIKVGPDGGVKVLDFGLARAIVPEPSGSAANLSQSPTITSLMTGASVILGTAAYMSPEQARGRPVDRRADIWAFGVVLFEMLTGRQLFDGETISDTIAAVLKTEPDWSLLPSDTPASIVRLIRRCLERDPRQRLRDIGEARILLEQVIAGVGAEAPAAAAAGEAPPPTRRSRVAVASGVTGGLVGGVILMLALGGLMRPPRVEAPLRKFHLDINGDENSIVASPVLSPDGRMVAYRKADGIWLQDLAKLEPKELVADPAARTLFWSPDNRYLGYISGTRLCRVSVADGQNETICDTRASFAGGHGATWRDDGTIVFSRADSAGLMIVSSRGGDARNFLPINPAEETDFHDPFALSGDRGILFSSHRKSHGYDNICLFANGKRKVLLTVPDQLIDRPRYAAPGYIIFNRRPTNAGTWAIPFSLSRLEVTGEPFLVASAATAASTSSDGTMAYLEGAPGASTQLLWADRNGRELGKIGTPESNSDQFPALSKDGVRVALASVENDNTDIWIYDTVRGTRTRLTFGPGTDVGADWSPDGRWIAHQAIDKNCSSPSCWSILLRPSDGTGTADTLAKGVSANFSPDGQFLLFSKLSSNNQWDIWYLRLTGDRKPVPLIASNSRKVEALVSPDGRYMAYSGNESGQWEIYLTRFPSGQGKWQVSVHGGSWPRWNGRGDRLYFAQADDIMEVEVSTAGESPTLSAPAKLFSRPSLGPGGFGWYAGYDVASDGSRFIVLKSEDARGGHPGITVVQNWFSEFKENGR